MERDESVGLAILDGGAREWPISMDHSANAIFLKDLTTLSTPIFFSLQVLSFFSQYFCSQIDMLI